jgi:serine/threonine protein kinase
MDIMTPGNVGSCAWLVEELVAARLVEHERLVPFLEEFAAEFPFADADEFAKHLVREGILTRYQAKRALEGDARKLQLGAYLIVDILGSGCLGTVHRAVGRADRKPYAIRVLPQRAWNLGLARKQIRSFENLPPHERLVPFVDVGTAHGLHYLVWPFTEGRSLDAMVRECGPLSSGEAARIGVEVAEVLKLCHARDIVHGFIRPNNVLITPDGHARLIDFGAGALLAENPEDESMVDTVSRAEAIAHMLECSAPESVVNSSNWTARGDQYSLGCTLYFALTGRYPFPGGSFVEKMLNHQQAKPTPIRSLNPDVKPALASVIDQLMRKDPGERYRKMDDLLKDLVPLATNARLREFVPVNAPTPMPGSTMTAGAPLSEPPRTELPARTEKRGLLGRFFGGSAGPEPLYATIVAAGPARPGDSIVLHVYTHGPADADRLSDAVRNHPASPRVLGQVATKRAVAVGDAFALHLGIDGVAVSDPLVEAKHGPGLGFFRFVVSLPSELGRKPLKGRLMVGQDSKMIAQIDFILPVIT